MSYKDPVLGFKATRIHEDLFSDPSLHHFCKKEVKVLVASVLSNSANPWTVDSSVHGILQARMLEWVPTAFLQGIFPTQGSNLGPLHCSWILH